MGGEARLRAAPRGVSFALFGLHSPFRRFGKFADSLLFIDPVGPGGALEEGVETKAAWGRSVQVQVL